MKLYATRENRRSLNKEAIFRLEQAYGFRPPDHSLTAPPAKAPASKIAAPKNALGNRKAASSLIATILEYISGGCQAGKK